jgi:uncharacterized integral membrane protein
MVDKFNSEMTAPYATVLTIICHSAHKVASTNISYVSHIHGASTRLKQTFPSATQGAANNAQPLQQAKDFCGTFYFLFSSNPLFIIIIIIIIIIIFSLLAVNNQDIKLSYLASVRGRPLPKILFFV